MPFYLRRHHQQIPDVIYCATVPFFGAQNDHPLIQDRTGVLLQIGDHHFLLTAVHELGQWFDLQAKSLLADESIFTSSGQVVYHEAAARGDETIRLEFVWCEFLTGVLDVAILELDDGSVQRLDGMTFLKIDDIRLLPAPEPNKGTFILYGHPLFLNDPGAPGIPTAIAPVGWFDTTLADPAIRPHHDQNNHLILHMPPEVQALEDEVIVGMSGCGIWLVGYDRDGTLGNRSVLLGIFHCFSKPGKWVAGTSLKCVLDAIAAKYPALAGEIATVKSL